MPKKKAAKIDITVRKLRAAFKRLREARRKNIDAAPRVRWIARVGRRESVHTNAAAARRIAGTRGTVTRYVEAQP